ncbi:MAG TPA: tRNA pseudouridine(38-40) synthase TruA [Bryobacteraceae bacterium]|nr:tRNA pseudouridine(38-40) synthase TruA [Bryobacteraceae bacterium]
MKTWKVTLEYDGTKYSGWQEQNNARTVAGSLRAAVEDTLGTSVELMGAGRTDAGVHALGQVAHIKLRKSDRRHPRYAPEQLVRQFNERLPSDISVIDIEDVPVNFHARHSATARSYVYQISTRKTAFHKRHVWWIKEPLDIAAMQAAAEKFAGRHDFVRFAQKDPSKPNESTIVYVDSAEVTEDDSLVLFRIEASHFLWRMVRRLVGVTVKAGLGEVTLAEVDELLAGKGGARLDVAAWTAPAAGLFLNSVRY